MKSYSKKSARSFMVKRMRKLNVTEIQRKQKVLRDSLESKRKAEAKAQAKKDADAEQTKAKRM